MTAERTTQPRGLLARHAPLNTEPAVDAAPEPHVDQTLSSINKASVSTFTNHAQDDANALTDEAAASKVTAQADAIIQSPVGGPDHATHASNKTLGTRARDDAKTNVSSRAAPLAPRQSTLQRLARDTMASASKATHKFGRDAVEGARPAPPGKDIATALARHKQANEHGRPFVMTPYAPKKRTQEEDDKQPYKQPPSATRLPPISPRRSTAAPLVTPTESFVSAEKTADDSDTPVPLSNPVLPMRGRIRKSTDGSSLETRMPPRQQSQENGPNGQGDTAPEADEAESGAAEKKDSPVEEYTTATDFQRLYKRMSQIRELLGSTGTPESTQRLSVAGPSAPEEASPVERAVTPSAEVRRPILPDTSPVAWRINRARRLIESTRQRSKLWFTKT